MGHCVRDPSQGFVRSGLVRRTLEAWAVRAVIALVLDGECVIVLQELNNGVGWWCAEDCPDDTRIPPAVEWAVDDSPIAN